MFSVLGAILVKMLPHGTPTAPRVAARQRHPANASASTAKKYYRINVAAPFLDHIILQLGERFDANTVQASRLLALVPSVMNEM